MRWCAPWRAIRVLRTRACGHCTMLRLASGCALAQRAGPASERFLQWLRWIARCAALGSVAILSEEWFCDILSPAADETQTACFPVFPLADQFGRVYNTTYGRSLLSARLGVIRGGASTHD
jgi:hypothetical protein